MFMTAPPADVELPPSLAFDAAGPLPSREAAEAYCRRLAHTHYENFTVASWLLPRRLRQPFFNVYAYCRGADDLADEVSDVAQSAALLDWWEAELNACYAGEARHPVFVALRETIAEFQIPQQVFADLLVAFRQDQQVTSYATIDELLGYCRYSANPVGHLILYLGNCYDAQLAGWSDSICTGLQLANFCQDVARDYARGRIYLPAGTWESNGYTSAMFAAREFNASFQRALRQEVDRAEAFLLEGRPLLPHLPRDLQLDVTLFLLGGLSILSEIRRADYNVWAARPTVSKWRKLALVPQAWWNCRRAPRDSREAARFERIQGARR
jgi:squalene synthase HpnC